MIIHNVAQGTHEWQQLRLGIPTASGFSNILTPKKLEPSAQAPKYATILLAEWLLGYPLDLSGNGGWQDRGTGTEAEARAWYELRHDVDVLQVGFILRDDEKVGGSPDALVGDEGGAEFKVPALHTHLGYLTDPNTLVKEYQSQVQGYMYLTDRAWWDLVSYHPVLPKVDRRVARDEKYIAALAPALDAFVMYLDELKSIYREYKYNPERAVS